MAYPHRIFRNDRFYRVRNYCCDGQPFFRHTPRTNRYIVNLLCKYAAKREIKLAGFVFMPTFFEMILMAPKLNLDEFMRDFQGQVARVLGEYWGRSGPFFVGRYHDSEIDPECLVDAYTEMMCLPVSENFVDHPEEWPGVTSWSAMISGGAIVGVCQNREAYWKMRRRKCNEYEPDAKLEQLATESYEITLARLPEWHPLEPTEYTNTIRETVAARIACIRAFSSANAVGVDSIAEQPCEVRPGIDCRRIPLYTTGSISKRTACWAKRKRDVKQYRKAARRLRCGQKKAYFPVGMFPPGHLHAVGSPGARAAGETRGVPVLVPDADESGAGTGE